MQLALTGQNGMQLLKQRLSNFLATAPTFNGAADLSHGCVDDSAGRPISQPRRNVAPRRTTAARFSRRYPAAMMQDHQKRGPIHLRKSAGPTAVIPVRRMKSGAEISYGPEGTRPVIIRVSFLA